jgi:aspartate aminotransferase-like enzyme
MPATPTRHRSAVQGRGRSASIFTRRPKQTSSPTVTALRVPEDISWQVLDRRLREHGMVVGGSLGPLDGKVFRIGHMGTQADRALLERAMDVIAGELGL